VPDGRVLAARARRRSLDALASPVAASLVLAVVVAAAIIAVSGADPVTAYSEMWRGAVTGNGPRTVVDRAVPIVGMALAVSIPFRAGIVYIGAEGAMVVGGFSAAVVAVELDGPGSLVMIASFLAGAATGALWALIPALAQTRLHLPILISGLLLNEPARALTSWLTKNAFADPAATSTSTVQIHPDVRVPGLGFADGATGTALLVLALVVAIALVNARTAPGYQSWMSGLNLRFSRYGGVDAERQTLVTMVAGGAIAGTVGAHLVLGQAFRFVDGDLPGTGFAWTGLLVCLLAANRALPILVAGLLFAALQVGGLAMQRNAGVSGQLAQVLQAVVILALAMRIVFVRRRSRAGGSPANGAEAAPAPVPVGAA